MCGMRHAGDEEVATGKKLSRASPARGQRDGGERSVEWVRAAKDVSITVGARCPSEDICMQG